MQKSLKIRSMAKQISGVAKHEIKVSAGKKGRSVKDWAIRINGAWRAAAEAYIECGKVLIEAKDMLNYGEWTKLLTDPEYLDFDERKAQRLMKIAKTQLFLKPANIAMLPPSYSTLEILSRMPNEALAKAFKKGDVHPNMERADAEELVELAKPKKPSREADDAEVEEEEDERQVIDHDPDEKPATKGKVKEKVKQSTVVKGGSSGGMSPIEAAISNFGNGVDSLKEFIETLDEKMEAEFEADRDATLPKQILADTKILITNLQRVVKEYS